MKKKYYIFILIITLIGDCAIHAQEFAFPIKVSDGLHQKIIHIGVHPDGSSGFDPGLDTLAPPAPPGGVFDTRLRYLNEDYYTDIRENSLEQKIYYLFYSPNSGRTITLYWDHTIINQLGDFIIKDNITGELFLLDMSVTDSLDNSQYPILQSSLRILVTPDIVNVIGEPGNEERVLSYNLAQNYPNPFNPVTTIEFTLPETMHVELEVFSVLGQKIKTLVSEILGSGTHSVCWDGTNESGFEATSSIYIYSLSARNYNVVKKMTLTK